MTANDYLTGPLQRALEDRILTGARYMGVPAWKNPLDAWVYQELVHELRPDWIVEVGNNSGGGLLYLAHLCDLVGHGLVLGVDNDRAQLAAAAWTHPRVRLVNGDAVEVYPAVAALVRGRALVIEDSAHTFDHTLAVLRLYSALVKPGGYLICEDGVMPDVADAIETFLDEWPEFEADRSREWPITWNPNGYLRRR